MGVLTLIFVATGLPIGYHIAKLSKTELIEGKKYFVWAERFLLAIIAGLFANSLVGLNASIGAGLLTLALLWEYPIKNYHVAGIVLGIASSIAGAGSPLVLMTTYAYFLIAGTQTYIHKQSRWKPALTYLATAILLGLLTGTARTMF